MKRFHGLDRARGYGLKSIALQARLTALVVNLKTIAALAASFLHDFYGVLTDDSRIAYLSLQRCG
ncbi:hypothetical protein SDC9_13647 [bioreactor metagenome]|uniref:Transposase DDE domain-containing protein n=1 Tax=bioreactor metagenome TaxID=1076179 RepID=A0A644TLX4_9ZZZZ